MMMEKRTKFECNDVDSISSLPDDTLQHILSFVETPEAARTSILSKRWRYMRAYTPALDICSTGFNLKMTKSKLRCVLRNHKSLNLRRLRLSCRYYEDGDAYKVELRRQYLDELMDYLLKRISKVEELSLAIRHPSSVFKVNIPRDIFFFQNLRILELTKCEIGDVGTIKLPRVEKLLLRSVSTSVKLLNNLISGCYNVKYFTWQHYYMSKSENVGLNLSLQELKVLMISHCYLRNFTINPPKLRYVKYIGGAELNATQLFSMANSLDLKYADLQVVPWESNDELFQIKNLIHEFGLTKVLHLSLEGCSHLPLDLFQNSLPCPKVKKLALDHSSISSALSILRLFPNLQDFTFSFCEDNNLIPKKDVFQNHPPCCNVRKLVIKNGISSVLLMLKLFPNLEDFTFSFSYDDFTTKSEDLSDVLIDGSIFCLKHSLKRMEIDKFSGTDIQLKMVKFLSKNAMLLNTIKFTNYSESFARLVATKRAHRKYS